MELLKLAQKITSFVYDYDYYEFCDVCDSFEEAIEETITDLQENRDSIINYLEGFIDEYYEECGEKAIELIKEIENL